MNGYLKYPGWILKSSEKLADSQNAMSKALNDNSARDHRLERATRHVSDYWMPVNPNLLKHLQRELQVGAFDNDLSSLLLKIRTDVSLFTQCLCQLLSMMKAAGESIPSPLNPVLLLESCDLERLKSLLNGIDPAASPHSLGQASDCQAARFQEMLISAASAQTLAKSYAIDSDTAFAAALLRQLGYALIAWNYPGAYEEAIGSLTSGKSLDEALSQKLGFSPMLLAVRVLHQRGVSAGACAELGLHEDTSEEDCNEHEEIGYTMTKLCSVGEALARANNPDYYPSARQDWRAATTEIEERLGRGGLDLIREKYEESIENYVGFIPHILDTGLNLDPKSFTVEDRADQLLEINPFLGMCEQRVERKLRAIYRRLSSGTISSEIISLLVHGAIPAAGFNSGCIYTVDPGLFMLVPQLEISKMRLRQATQVPYSLVESESDIVARAFQAQEPIQVWNPNACNGVRGIIAGMFGFGQPLGVLYLEMDSAVPTDLGSLHLAHFNAFRQTLSDCFSLS
ncbi:MAG: hypothetical protein GX589_05725 [Deltaproteobacteria bacterium]|nr:hypothetical protein [Deltaproteobacteria bacterium]